MSVTSIASEPSTQSGPLAGVRILDFTHFLAGPYATSIMAHLGADVVKVEDPTYADETRLIGPFTDDGLSLYFASLNSGKRDLALNLRSSEARAVLARLATKTDVVVHNYRPGTADKLGLGHDFFSSVNPRIITCAISGFGETGPYAPLPGYDYTIQAMSGVMSLTGEPGGPPGKAGISYVDHSGGLTAAFAIVTALFDRERYGRGKHLDVSLFDMQISMLSYIAAWHLNAGVTVERTARGSHPTLVPAQTFETADGYFSLFVGNDEMWQRFARALDDPWLTEDFLRTNPQRLERRAELINYLTGLFLKKSTADWIELLREAKVACAPIATVEQALADSHTNERNTVRHAGGSHGYSYVSGPVPTLELRHNLRPAPAVGDSTRDVLSSVGYSDKEIDELLRSNVVSVTDRAGQR